MLAQLSLLDAFPAAQKPKDLPTDTPLDFALEAPAA
mgnify:CR=1 FL=1